MSRVILIFAVGGVALLAWLLGSRIDPRLRADRTEATEARRQTSETAWAPNLESNRPGESQALSGAAHALFSGVVVDPGGWPVRVALVMMAAYPEGIVDPNPAGSGSTDANGRFAVRDVVVGGRARYCSVFHSGYRAIRDRRVEPGSELRFVLDPGLQVRGRVRFPDGSPAPRVAVDKDPWTVHTDDDGSFVFGGLDPGPVALECRTADSRAEEPEAPERIEVGAGRSDVEFVLEDSLLLVRIRDEEGREMEGVHCRYGVGDSTRHHVPRRPFFSRLVAAGASGHVILNRSGYLPVRVNYGPVSDVPQMIERVAVLRQAPYNSIELRVLTADGESFPGYAPRVDVLDDDDVVLRREILSLRDSKATLSDLPACAVRLRVFWQTTKLVATRTVEIRPGHDNAAEFVLPVTGTLTEGK